MTDPSTTSGKDPRCPHCGRPVVGVFVPGNEGHYHPECVRPPVSVPVPVHPSVPVWPQPYPAPWDWWGKPIWLVDFWSQPMCANVTATTGTSSR